MSKYEVVYIVDARLSRGRRTRRASRWPDLIGKLGGKVVDSRSG